MAEFSHSSITRMKKKTQETDAEPLGRGKKKNPQTPPLKKQIKCPFYLIPKIKGSLG
jgi:hypothetical protein